MVYVLLCLFRRQGIDFYVQMHLDGAGMKECDHWHDDAGIMLSMCVISMLMGS